MKNLQQLKNEVIALVAELHTQERRSLALRIKVGKALLAARKLLTVRNADGVILRGQKGGSFSKFLDSCHLNACMAYSYMALAGGKTVRFGKQHPLSNYQSQPSRVRINYWEKFNSLMRGASDAQKLVLLRRAVKWLCHGYKIEAEVSIK